MASRCLCYLWCMQVWHSTRWMEFYRHALMWLSCFWCQCTFSHTRSYFSAKEYGLPTYTIALMGISGASWELGFTLFITQPIDTTMAITRSLWIGCLALCETHMRGKLKLSMWRIRDVYHGGCWLEIVFGCFYNSWMLRALSLSPPNGRWKGSCQWLSGCNFTTSCGFTESDQVGHELISWVRRVQYELLLDRH